MTSWQVRYEWKNWPWIIFTISLEETWRTKDYFKKLKLSGCFWLLKKYLWKGLSMRRLMPPAFQFDRFLKFIIIIYTLYCCIVTLWCCIVRLLLFSLLTAKNSLHTLCKSLKLISFLIRLNTSLFYRVQWWRLIFFVPIFLTI